MSNVAPNLTDVSSLHLSVPSLLQFLAVATSDTVGAMSSD